MLTLEPREQANGQRKRDSLERRQVGPEGYRVQFLIRA